MINEYAYYLVQKVGGAPAVHRHATYAAAHTEADRLARKIGGKYIIFHAVGEVHNIGVYHNQYHVFEQKGRE